MEEGGPLMSALALLLLWSVLLNTALCRRPDGDGTPLARGDGEAIDVGAT